MNEPTGIPSTPRKRTRDIGREGVRDGLLEVVEDKTTLLYSANDRREIVVQQDHIGGLFRHGTAHDAHSNTDIRLLQRGRIVHTVTRYSHDVSNTLIIR